MVYHSLNDGELPIVIDTGTSCSIVPNPSHLDDDPAAPEFSHLSSISSKTAING